MKTRRVLLIGVGCLLLVEVLLRTLCPLADPHPRMVRQQRHLFLPTWNWWPSAIEKAPPFVDECDFGPLKGVAGRQTVAYTVNPYGLLFDPACVAGKAANELRVGILGGSAVECIALQEDQRISAQLERKLKDSVPNRPVRVLNLGVSGQATPTHLATMSQLGVKLRLDVLVLVLGANDAIRAAPDWQVLQGRQALMDVEFCRPPCLYVMATRTQVGRWLRAGLRGLRSHSPLPLLRRRQPYFAPELRRVIQFC